MNGSFLRQVIYLALAILGGGFTYYNLMLGISANAGNFDVVQFVKSTWVDDFYARSLTVDFWTGAITGTLFMVIEGMRLKVRYWWIYIVLTFLIAFAFAFPLFLFVRERLLHKK
jgi:Terpene cyclase DEP1